MTPLGTPLRFLRQAGAHQSHPIAERNPPLPINPDQPLPFLNGNAERGIPRELFADALGRSVPGVEGHGSVKMISHDVDATVADRVAYALSVESLHKPCVAIVQHPAGLRISHTIHQQDAIIVAEDGITPFP